MKKALRFIIVFVVILAVAWWWFTRPPPLGEVDFSGPTADWPAYGGNPGGEKHSSLTQITPQNVFHLENVWTYHTGDVSDGSTREKPEKSAFEATPILVDDTLYFCTPFNRVIALDPASGQELWTYDPKIDLSRSYSNQLTCRGVSSWHDEQAVTRCKHRIFTTTNDSRLIALDGATGKTCEDFGENGQIQLARPEDVGETAWPGEYQ
ncbi:MAG: PQQ-binding-like beta-propeller repeat protein, partial [Pseudomonadota bacterium]